MENKEITTGPKEIISGPKENKELIKNKKLKIAHTISKQKSEKLFQKVFSYKSYILYFKSKEMLNGQLIGLSKRVIHGNIVRIGKDQSITIESPSFLLFGKDIYAVVKGIPYTCPLVLKDIREFCREYKISDKEIEKLPEKSFNIIDIGYTAFDMDVMNHSQAVQSAYRVKKLTVNTALYYVMSIIIACLIEYVFFMQLVKTWK